MLENRLRFTTGLAAFDHLIGPLGPKRLVVFSGISQSGMTTMLLTVARNAAVNQGVETLFVDLETSPATIAARLLAGEASVDHRRFGHLEGSDAAAVATARALLHASPIQLAGPGPFTVDEIRSMAMLTRPRPQLIVIDGIRYLTGLEGDQQAQLDQLSIRLKQLAGQLDATVVVSHPLRHTAESERWPSLEHVDTAMGLVNHADQFVIIHRPELYATGSRSGETELRVVKSRQGPPGTVSVTAELSFSRFTSLEASGRAAA
ncbi:DnaB-like helicase C-terminal domain-containing protein [Plantactinospora sp. WMMB782]|uniref:DnaB-like helicase C-terminal domain-containing protein n=1 Tax=Plantactinospora sp. WMMB782 TaxID=3404121 RepID=UPI003B94ECD7